MHLSYRAGTKQALLPLLPLGNNYSVITFYEKTRFY